MENDHSSFAVLSVLLLFVLVTCILSLLRWTSITSSDIGATLPSLSVSSHVLTSTPSRVPFLVLDEPDWNLMSKTIALYERELSAFLGGLSNSLEVCLQSEDVLGLTNKFLSRSLQTKIERLSKLHDHNFQLLQEMLEEFPTQKMLPERAFCQNDDNNNDANKFDTADEEPVPASTTSKASPPPRRRMAPSVPSSYDSVHQIVAHLVRDWTLEGASARSSVYDWCRKQVKGTKRSILVPGAGLGRLAWDLSQDGHWVEANEVSVTMAAVAYHLFQNTPRFVIYPFATDFFVNEVNSKLRFQSVKVNRPNTSVAGHLSYTIGDFVRIYGSQQSSSYDVVVTCFFLDTATNVLEYFAVLSNVLRMGGQWINIGPLQWHTNAHLQPAADELKKLIPIFGFRINHWSIDTKPVDYRFEDPTRSTKYEGYQPPNGGYENQAKKVEVSSRDLRT
ncbi:hypothetical protein MHU86_15407 [Fragilaria crotonensis]|nr:hypothetical protein MHU86_15407 [Fragilaria crotonensis]